MLPSSTLSSLLQVHHHAGASSRKTSTRRRRGGGGRGLLSSGPQLRQECCCPGGGEAAAAPSVLLLLLTCLLVVVSSVGLIPLADGAAVNIGPVTRIVGGSSNTFFRSPRQLKYLSDGSIIVADVGRNELTRVYRQNNLRRYTDNYLGAVIGVAPDPREADVVYTTAWSNSAAVRRVVLGGSATTLSQREGNPHGIDYDTDSDVLYFATAGGLRSVPKTGGGSVSVASTGDSLDACIRQGTGEVFMLVRDGTVRRVRLAGGAAAVVAGRSGDKGSKDATTGTDARFTNPHFGAVSRGGEYLFISDTNNHAVRRMNLETYAVDTVFNSARVQATSYAASYSTSVDARIAKPWGLAFNTAGDTLAIVGNFAVLTVAYNGPLPVAVAKELLEFNRTTTVAMSPPHAVDAAGRDLTITASDPGTIVDVYCSNFTTTVVGTLELNVTEGAVVVVHNCSFSADTAVFVDSVHSGASVTFRHNVVQGRLAMRAIRSAAMVSLHQNEFSRFRNSDGGVHIAADSDGTINGLESLAVAQNVFTDVPLQIGADAVSFSNVDDVSVSHNVFSGAGGVVRFGHSNALGTVTVSKNTWGSSTAAGVGGIAAITFDSVFYTKLVHVQDNTIRLTTGSSSPMTTAIAVGTLFAVKTVVIDGQHGSIAFSPVSHFRVFWFKNLTNIVSLVVQNVGFTGTATDTSERNYFVFWDDSVNVREVLLTNVSASGTWPEKSGGLQMGSMKMTAVKLYAVTLDMNAGAFAAAVTVRASGPGVSFTMDSSTLNLGGSYKIKGIVASTSSDGGSGYALTIQRSTLRVLSTGQGGHVLYLGGTITVHSSISLVENTIELQCLGFHGLVGTAVVYVDRYNGGETMRDSTMHLVANAITLRGERQHVFKMASTEQNVTHYIVENDVQFGQPAPASSNGAQVPQLVSASSSGSDRPITLRCNTLDSNEVTSVGASYPELTVVNCGTCNVLTDCTTAHAVQVSYIDERCHCRCNTTGLLTTIDPSLQCDPDWPPKPWRELEPTMSRSQSLLPPAVPSATRTPTAEQTLTRALTPSEIRTASQLRTMSQPRSTSRTIEVVTPTIVRDDVPELAAQLTTLDDVTDAGSKAAAAATVATGALTVRGVGAGSVARAGRVQSVSGLLAQCRGIDPSPDDVADPDPVELPFPLPVAIGASLAPGVDTRRLTGAVLIATGLCVVGAALPVALWLRGVQSRGAVSGIVSALGTVLPSYFAPNVVAASGAFIRSGQPDTTLWAVLVVCMVLCAASAGMYVVIGALAPRYAAPRIAGRDGDTFTGELRDASRPFTAYLGPCVDGCRDFRRPLHRQYAAVDVWCAILIAACMVLPGKSCAPRVYAAATVALLYLLYLFAARPYRSPVEMAFVAGAGTLQFLSTATLAVIVAPQTTLTGDDKQRLEGAAGWFLLGTMVLLVLQPLALVALEAVARFAVDEGSAGWHRTRGLLGVIAEDEGASSPDSAAAHPLLVVPHSLAGEADQHPKKKKASRPSVRDAAAAADTTGSRARSGGGGGPSRSTSPAVSEAGRRRHTALHVPMTPPPPAPGNTSNDGSAPPRRNPLAK